MDDVAKEFPELLRDLIGILLANDARKKPRLFGSEEKVKDIILLRYPFYIVSVDQGKSIAFDGRDQTRGRIDCPTLPLASDPAAIAELKESLSNPEELASALEALQKRIEIRIVAAERPGLLSDADSVGEIGRIYSESDFANEANNEEIKEKVLPCLMESESIPDSGKAVAGLLLLVKKSLAMLDYLEDVCNRANILTEKEAAMASVELRDVFDSRIRGIKPGVDIKVRNLTMDRETRIASLESQRKADTSPILKHLKSVEAKLSRVEKTLDLRMRKLSSKRISQNTQSRKFWKQRVDAAKKEFKKLDSLKSKAEKRIVAISRTADDEINGINFVFSSRIYSETEKVTKVEAARDAELARVESVVRNLKAAREEFLKKLEYTRGQLNDGDEKLASIMFSTEEFVEPELLAVPLWVATLVHRKDEGARKLLIPGIVRYNDGETEFDLKLMTADIESRIFKRILRSLELNPIPEEFLKQPETSPALTDTSFEPLLASLSERDSIPFEQVSAIREILGKAV